MKIIYLVTSILGFSYNIHRYLGTNLCNLLQKDNKFTSLNETLQGESCDQASIWADEVKLVYKYRWTSVLHFINIYECKKKYNIKYIENACNGGFCIYKGIINTYEGRYNNLNKTENIKLLLHLTQDFFQPFHIYGLFNGGNDLELIRNKNGRNKTVNLHQLFDDEMFEYFIKTENYVPSVDLTKNLETCSNLHVLLLKNLENTMQIACDFYNKIPESGYVIFEELYDREKIKFLLDSYFDFAYNLF